MVPYIDDGPDQSCDTKGVGSPEVHYGCWVGTPTYRQVYEQMRERYVEEVAYTVQIDMVDFDFAIRPRTLHPQERSRAALTMRRNRQEVAVVKSTMCRAETVQRPCLK
ncbi:MAG: hypothetical protein WCG85_12895 [Polyangia bacterium]